MSADYRVEGKSNAQVRAIAKQARQYFGVSNKSLVDVINCLKRERIWTVKGERLLRFEVCPDQEMGPHDALTIFEKDVVVILVKKSVLDMAFFGDGRSRNTLAHEIGHAVLHHDKAPMARHTLAVKAVSWIAAFESAEHQAKVFAAAFLINDAVAESLNTAEGISAEFGISLESARIYFDGLNERRNRERDVQEVLRKAQTFKESVSSKKAHRLPFLDEPCPVCSHQTLLPLWHKTMCQTCETIFDRPQDGDR